MKKTYSYATSFDKDVVSDLKKIDERIKDEIENGNPDSKKLLKLKMAKLYRGMEMNSMMTRRGNKIPY